MSLLIFLTISAICKKRSSKTIPLNCGKKVESMQFEICDFTFIRNITLYDMVG